MSVTFSPHMPHPICATPYKSHTLHVPHPICATPGMSNKIKIQVRELSDILQLQDILDIIYRVSLMLIFQTFYEFWLFLVSRAVGQKMGNMGSVLPDSLNL